MATSSNSLSEEQVTCSICLNVFTDPVTTPCGHNFCMTCIRRHRNSSPHSQCPLCGEKFDSSKFKINTTVKEISEHFKGKRTQVTCDSCSKRKRKALKSCLHCETSFCEVHLEPHKTAEKLKKHKLIDPVENLEDYVCKKHKRPLELFCRDDQTYVCYFCTETDHKSHNTVPMDEESEILQATVKIKMQMMIQDREQKIAEIKDSLRLIKETKERETQENFKFFNQLIEGSHAELLESMEEREKAAERQAEELITELEQEVSELKTKYAKLDQLSNPTYHPYQLQIPSYLSSRKHQTDVGFHTHIYLEPLRLTLSQLQEGLDEKIKEIVSKELNSIRRYSVDVTLDPDTAHPELLLSDDGKQVWNGGKTQNVPNSPFRFDWCSCVLGKEGFSGGRFYYEVQVSGKTEWDLGMATESINRKGDVELGPENGSWTIWLRNGNTYDANEIPPVRLSLKEKPQKVGVFVDYEQGVVSFYDVEAKYHIYSFTGQSFSQRLYPYFSPGENERGKNLAPLIITAVSNTEQ
ncbi:nuclear factor 7, brain-like [Colossoma macropomum]|uniref:nuclear factor 7, brain-like n=1 Tax=Colossoma macropomum TaxID=42526 RepID=UPI0018655F5A|nr:nuclear factor 7, brain-like [Colossoma macropomum]